MEFLVGALILVLLVRWAVISSRLRDIERTQSDQAARSATRIRELEDRIAHLERAPGPAAPPSQPAPAPKPAYEPIVVPRPIAAPEIVHPPPLPAYRTACQFCGRIVEPGLAVCACGAVLDPARAPSAEPAMPPPLPAPVFAAPPALAPALPRESLRDRVKKQVGDQEWEAMVGGNWLNKAGVLLLVIGLALLLGYEFARVGPFGRVAIGLGSSLTLLIAGVLIERKPIYAIFARGLIGGGWAALYFTTYAMHAIDAARVIDNAYAATLLLLAVALGMILHSLRYRSQTVSGLAYFIAFATLALSESTPFSVTSLIPLAASLLFLAYRFEWTRMAVFGVVATYMTCASRPDTGAPLASTQALFGMYWLLFEAFDLMRLRRRVRGFTIESLLLPLNTLGFLGLSLVKWDRTAHQNLYLALAAGGILYLLSALIRVRLSPPSEDEPTLERMASGGYEGPITISATLTAIAIFRKAPGMWINAGLLIEAEILFLAGVRFGQKFLRQLAGGVFVSALAKLMADVSTGDTIQLANRTWMRWTPATILTAVAFYANRAFNVIEKRLYSSLAAALIVLILAFETPQQYLCVAWLLFATLLFEIGFRFELDDFLFQSYAAGALGTGAALLLNISVDRPDWPRQWLPMAICAALQYAVTLQIRFRPGRLKYEPIVSWFTSASTAGLALAIAWKLAPGDYLGVTWIALGAMLFELGLWKLPPQFRRISYAVSATGFFNLLYLHVILAHKDSPVAEPISLAIATILCYAISARLFRSIPDRIPDIERSWTRDANAAAATLFILTLAWLKLPAPVVALAWAMVSLILLELGFAFAFSRFRLIGNLVAAAVFGRLFLANFTDLGNTVRISHRILTVVPIVIAQYYVWARYRRTEVSPWETSLARLYVYAPAILSVVLLRFELGRSMAVVGWALFGLAVYRTGLVKNIGDLRWQSYAIAILAFWRCWNTNFYIPESLAGISGRVATAALVIASFYAAQLLSPREPAEAVPQVDRHARTFFSLLASILLAVLLFYQVSGSLLTTAWGIEAVALIAAGFPLRDRLQRLSGLFLFLVCVLKLFLYDLRQLETINRILSFIILGVILVSVSWVYTRFRDRIQRYL
ncbi:MAG TPA: DUF2339 domain-containing protein [Bryobacteraceae bacterium]|nr:DUF2339 domain-containing protein [Bryobacteraceae bacterium]